MIFCAMTKCLHIGFIAVKKRILSGDQFCQMLMKQALDCLFGTSMEKTGNLLMVVARQLILNVSNTIMKLWIYINLALSQALWRNLAELCTIYRM